MLTWGSKDPLEVQWGGGWDPLELQCGSPGTLQKKQLWGALQPGCHQVVCITNSPHGDQGILSLPVVTNSPHGHQGILSLLVVTNLPHGHQGILSLLVVTNLPHGHQGILSLLVFTHPRVEVKSPRTTTWSPMLGH